MSVRGLQSPGFSLSTCALPLSYPTFGLVKEVGVGDEPTASSVLAGTSIKHLGTGFQFWRGSLRLGCAAVPLPLGYPAFFPSSRFNVEDGIVSQR